MVQQNLAESYTLATESDRIQHPLLGKNRKHTFKKTWKNCHQPAIHLTVVPVFLTFPSLPSWISPSFAKLTWWSDQRCVNVKVSGHGVPNPLSHPPCWEVLQGVFPHDGWNPIDDFWISEPSKSWNKCHQQPSATQISAFFHVVSLIFAVMWLQPVDGWFVNRERAWNWTSIAQRRYLGLSENRAPHNFPWMITTFAI